MEVGTVPYIDVSRKNLITVILIYITIFLNSYVFFKEPFEFYIGYLVYVLFLPGFFVKYGFNRNLFLVFGVLFVTGIVGIISGNNNFPAFMKIFIGLFFSYMFYYYIIIELEFNIEQLFKWYLKGAYICALLGVWQFVSFKIGYIDGYTFFGLLNKWGISYGGFFGFRVNSIFMEPTYLGTVLSAAFFISVYNLIVKKTFYLTKFQSITIVIIYLMSFSGCGQIGIFLTLIFIAISYGLVRYFIILVPVATFLFYYLYNNVKEFKDRYDGIITMFSGEKFVLGKTHGSSFILYNSYIVALENFKSSFLFGGGLASHETAFGKYSLARNFKTVGFNQNAADASSMLLRLLSETGVFGVSIILYIVFKCYVKRNRLYDTNHWLVSNAILVLILLNLLRQGHYFLYGFPFFIFLYVYNSEAYRAHVSKNKLVEHV